MDFKGAILDFDEVLGRTEGYQYLKWNVILGPRYGVWLTPQDYASKYCGKSSKDEIPALLCQHFPQIEISPSKLADLARQELDYFFGEHKIELMPGAHAGLVTLANYFGLENMSVCSAKNDEELEMKLVSAQVEWWFPGTKDRKHRSTQEEAGKGKPAPDMYILAAKRLGFEPKECFAVEDTQAGVDAAAAAGVYVVAMPTIFSTGQDLSRANLILKGGWPEFIANAELILNCKYVPSA
ncbi:MAG: HAD family phosphatase [Candidatus Paceibacterota bacterium]